MRSCQHFEPLSALHVRHIRFLIAFAALVLGALIAPPAIAKAPAEQPTLCQMASAFDEALRLRYYRANLAPDHIECNFLAETGCAYSFRRQIVIRVTHLEPVGCDAAGECAFRARQTCEIGELGANCGWIMSVPTSDYVVAGRFAPEGDRWRLTEWRREPTRPLSAEALVATQCPQIL